MKVGPFFKWFGSKWQSSKNYPKAKYDFIIEPFCGGAGYSCNQSDKNIVLFEINKDIYKLWHWLIKEATSDLIEQIPLNVLEQTDIRTLGLSEGQSLLLKNWQRTNNVGNCWTISPWGNIPGQWTASCKARLKEEIHAIKHWQIFQKFNYIHHNFDDVTWFIDTPYQYNYDYKVKGFNYQELSNFVMSIPEGCQIICCEAVGKNGEIPDYLPFQFSHSSVTSRRKETQSHHSKELTFIRG